MRRVIAVIVCLTFLGCMGEASAQSSCPIINLNVTPLPSNYVCFGLVTPPPIGAVCITYFGAGLPNPEMCAPLKSRPRRPRRQTCENQKPNAPAPPECANPIDLSTGNTYITQTDIRLPGLGGGLTLTRRWNSIPSTVYASASHVFGLNWQSTYEDRLVFQTSDNFLTEEDGGDGESAFSLQSFGPNTYLQVAPANRPATITTKMDSAGVNIANWTLVSPDGETRVYDPVTGALLSITDRNGNATQLTYDTSNRLVTVTDPASRHLNFTYVSPSSGLVSTVSSDVGISLSYAYDSNGRLIKVTKPDNTTVSFTYDGQNNITAVLDNEGKVLESHTYDATGRGKTSTRANGVDSVTVTYP